MGTLPIEKTIVIADAQVRSAWFVTWIAEQSSQKVRRFQYSHQKTRVTEAVDYVDIRGKSQVRRIIGIGLASANEPLLASVLRNATNVVFMVTKPQQADEPDLADWLINHTRLFDNQPTVYALFADSGKSKQSALRATFDAIGLMLICPEIGTIEFGALNTLLINGSTKVARNNIGKNGEIDDLLGDTVVPSSAAPTLSKVVPIDVAVDLSHTANAVSSINNTATQNGDLNMASVTESLATIMQIDGAMGCLVADYTSGMMLAKAGGGVNLEVAGAGNTEVIKAKMKTMASLGLKENIEDMLITLGTQYHILRPMAAKQGLFIYLVLDKAKANLAMARYKLLDVEKEMAL